MDYSTQNFTWAFQAVSEVSWQRSYDILLWLQSCIWDLFQTSAKATPNQPHCKSIPGHAGWGVKMWPGMMLATWLACLPMATETGMPTLLPSNGSFTSAHPLLILTSEKQLIILIFSDSPGYTLCHWVWNEIIFSLFLDGYFAFALDYLPLAWPVPALLLV